MITNANALVHFFLSFSLSTRSYNIIPPKLNKSRVKFTTPSYYAAMFSNLIVYHGNEISSRVDDLNPVTNETLATRRAGLERNAQFVRVERIYYPRFIPRISREMD